MLELNTQIEPEDQMTIQNAIDTAIERNIPRLLEVLRNDIAGEGYLNLKNAAKLLDMEESWLYNNAEKLGMPKIKVGGKVFFRKRDLIKWMERHKIPSTS